MMSESKDKSDVSVFTMVDRTKSAWFTWSDIVALNAGRDMTVKIVDIRHGEAGFGKDKSKLAAVFLEGIPKPLGCRITNLRSLYKLHGTATVGGLRGKLVTLFVGECRNPKFNPKEKDSGEEPTCKCVRIRNKPPNAASLYAATYDHAVTMEALATASEAGELEAIRMALNGQKPPEDKRDEIRAALAAATARIAELPPVNEAAAS